MRRDRRAFLASAGAGIVAGALGSACQRDGSRAGPRVSRASARGERQDAPSWAWVRRQFRLSPEHAHLSALLIASHPAPVREALDHHRRALDLDPTTYLVSNNPRLRRRALDAAARYLGGHANDVALTDSTTMGLGLIYNGLRLRPGDEVLSTRHEHYASHEAIRLATERSGATERRISLYEDGEVSTDAIVGRVAAALTPRTKVLALTWVHSSTGVKLPIAGLSKAVRAAERELGLDEPIVVCVDAVHGFGVEDVKMVDLDADFFIAGCHKWLFGPRGTGIVWGKGTAWPRTLPTIPSFMELDLHRAWLEREPHDAPTTAHAMAPGGFKAFEHQWALAEAFEFHEHIGRSRIAARTHELARQCKEGLSAMPHVRLHTPMSETLSSGIVCCDIEGMDPWTAATRLADRGIIASVTPYASRHLRFAPCIYNAPEDIEAALRAVHDLA